MYYQFVITMDDDGDYGVDNDDDYPVLSAMMHYSLYHHFDYSVNVMI
jgi:hypothetical protein